LTFHKNLDYSDNHAPSNQQIENNSGAIIAKGTVVRLDGFGVAFPRVKIANPASYANFGIAQADILVGSRGIVTCLGLMRGLNTLAFTVGSALYSTSAGALSTTPLGPVVATVLKQDSTDGILYVVASVDLAVGGSAAGWEVDGNLGTNPSSNFIGTSDNQGLSVRTNGLEAIRVTESQRFGLGTAAPNRHFEQKSHVSNNATGLQQETFYVETNSSAPQVCYALPIEDPSVYSVQIQFTARTTDGTKRAAFTRSMLVYRESSSVQIQGLGWQSDLTVKSDLDFNVSYLLTASAIIFKVKAPTIDQCQWTGAIRLQAVL
jgi:hypothetical protein